MLITFLLHVMHSGRIASKHCKMFSQWNGFPGHISWYSWVYSSLEHGLHSPGSYFAAHCLSPSVYKSAFPRIESHWSTLCYQVGPHRLLKCQHGLLWIRMDAISYGLGDRVRRHLYETVSGDFSPRSHTPQDSSWKLILLGRWWIKPIHNNRFWGGCLWAFDPSCLQGLWMVIVPPGVFHGPHRFF